MAIHPTGRTLALVTAGDSNSHFLRLYDVHRNARKETVEVLLEPYTKGYNFEVNCASFSPDGIFLALGRNDNITDVYDSRNMERGPLYGFFHDDPNRGVPGSESYGVVEAKWVEGRDGRRMGLITGGNDGCIRLWDCGISALEDTNGRTIAKTDFDVAHFALGDPYKGEKALVVGHCGGGVYIFDRLDGAAREQ
ncbi:hypothetical protein BV22DRAFT_1103751 [Leucogyrophana mollusca]|uniref:Uncharacterized protein n=1 Tax=Leucogyrophana mollusca TaxID=85980 RepID=A0ACB8BPA2_9AGAM|nr:hypothetical protein BV22DRAFT_1103751 [Leucogyrophana mollusca]